MRAPAFVLAACLVSPVLVVAQSRSGDALLLEWRKAVDAHRRGTYDEAAVKVGRWSSAELRAVLEALRPQLREDPRRPELDRLLVNGAVLHTDIAMLASRRAITSAPGDRFVALSVDGRDSGQQPREPGWPFAGQLLGQVSQTPELQSLVKLWFRAVSSHMLKFALLADVAPHLEEARRLYRDDPDLMFDTGCMYEGYAGPRAQAALADMTSPIRGQRPDTVSVGDGLAKAEEWYTRVLAVAPGHHEARLHRGRVRSLRGRQGEAVADLRAVSAAITEPFVKYHALLFLGGAYEAIDRIDDARAAYERAGALYIYAQSPHIALSRLATRRGDMPAAQRAIQQVLRLSPDAPDRGDPWWTYFDGAGRRSEALMFSLRDALAALGAL